MEPMSTVRLYALEPDRLRELPVPAGASDLHDVLDEQPLGIYEGWRTFHGDRFLHLERHVVHGRRFLHTRTDVHRSSQLPRRTREQELGRRETEVQTRVASDLHASVPYRGSADPRFLVCGALAVVGGETRLSGSVGWLEGATSARRCPPT